MIWLLTASKALHACPPVASTGQVDTGMKDLEETLISALIYFSKTKSHLPEFSTHIHVVCLVKVTKTIRPKPQEKPKPKPLHQMNLEPLLPVTLLHWHNLLPQCLALQGSKQALISYHLPSPQAKHLPREACRSATPAHSFPLCLKTSPHCSNNPSPRPHQEVEGKL